MTRELSHGPKGNEDYDMRAQSLGIFEMNDHQTSWDGDGDGDDEPPNQRPTQKIKASDIHRGNPSATCRRKRKSIRIFMNSPALKKQQLNLDNKAA